MGIRFVDDVGAPLAVTAIDLISETVKPEGHSFSSCFAPLPSLGRLMGEGRKRR